MPNIQYLNAKLYTCATIEAETAASGTHKTEKVSSLRQCVHIFKRIAVG